MMPLVIQFALKKALQRFGRKPVLFELRVCLPPAYDKPVEVLRLPAELLEPLCQPGALVIVTENGQTVAEIML